MIQAKDNTLIFLSLPDFPEFFLSELGGDD